MRGIVKGNRRLLLTRWMNLDSKKRQQSNQLFALNRRLMKAYLLKESLERLWTYRYETAMLRYLQSWIDELRWQPLAPFQNLSRGNIKTLLRRGRGYKNLSCLPLKAQPMAVTNTEFIVLQKAA